MATASATRTLVPGPELDTDSKSTPRLRGRNLEILRAIARRHKEPYGSCAVDFAGWCWRVGLITVESVGTHLFTRVKVDLDPCSAGETFGSMTFILLLIP
jgi:hypothetical protein